MPEINKHKCAPGNYDKDNDSCFKDHNEIMELCMAYNRYIVKNKMSINSLTRIKNTLKSENVDLIKIIPDKKHLLTELHNRLQNICHGDDHCITQQEFINEVVDEFNIKKLKKKFRPDGPSKQHEWFSTIHIQDILNQYQELYPNFKFLGAVPIDCSILENCQLYNIDFDKLYKSNKTKIGVVYNLSYHYEKGSHWVALFIDIDKGEIYYCNSGGKEAPHFVKLLVSEFEKFYKKLTNLEAKYNYNKQRYQFDNSECGVYVCNFIIRMLYGESFEQIVNTPLSFKDINSCRNAYFVNNTSKNKIHHLCDPHIF